MHTSTSRRSSLVAKDRFHRFLGTLGSPKVTCKETESGRESESDLENTSLNSCTLDGQKKPRKLAKLTIHSEDDDESDVCEDDQAFSGLGRRGPPIIGHDMFALERRDDKRPQPITVRQSARLQNRYRPFYEDEVDGDDQAQYEERSLMAYQRYNLRDRKPARASDAHHVRYNLRPHRGARMADNVHIPWSIADEYLARERRPAEYIPDKALMDATPELQPYESQMDNPQSVGDDDTSTLAPDDIAAQPIACASPSENPFGRIAGMDEHVRQLKEMVVFPLLYPCFFSRMGIAPPRGVLFHGPPGTGKTLMARLLAESCSTGHRKVAFFMRNGADCLSKWIGEAERNMKLLFQKAKECQPAIIFFDEIDGLAPERSGRADQSHISLVSTLLALMDGLDDRGNVVVIGATNRIHAIDPALRRPGRFDREFFFGLPAAATRHSILAIQTRHWDPRPDDGLLWCLARSAHGFSGADLKGLCTEAALLAIRRTVPEAYDLRNTCSEQSFVDRHVSVTRQDFTGAFRSLVPSTRRHEQTEQPLIPLPFGLLFTEQTAQLMAMVARVVGEPLCPASDDELAGASRWALEANYLAVALDYSPRYNNRILHNVASSLGTFKAVGVHLDKLMDAECVASYLAGQVFGPLKSQAPAILVVPDISDRPSLAAQLADAVGTFVRHQLLPTDPILVLACSASGIRVDGPSDSQMARFKRHVIFNEVRPLLLERLCRMELLAEYGREMGVDLSELLVSPFPDYDAFVASLQILHNREQVRLLAEPLLCLSSDAYFESISARSSPGRSVASAELYRLRMTRFAQSACISDLLKWPGTINNV